jgi:hypothetical protein
MGWTIGVVGFDSRRGPGIFLFTTAARTALGPTQPHIQWVPGALSPGVKRPGCEADHSPPSSAEVKEWVELYLYSPNTPSWRGAYLKHSENFNFFTTLRQFPWIILNHFNLTTCVLLHFTEQQCLSNCGDVRVTQKGRRGCQIRYADKDWESTFRAASSPLYKIV